MQHSGHAVTRTVEPGLTLFSAAEIRVVLLPVGEAPEAVFQRYASLIVQHRQVELNNVRSFYKESQKSPFKFFPWKTGNMHFKFLPEELALQTSPIAPLHNHRRVLGVIGLMHCPNVEDVAKAYAQFEQRCKAFPDAFTVRCFAFEPSDEQIQEDRKGQRNFIMFPPGDAEQLDNHAEVVMHDFAACLLVELERWMLNASPAMVELATLVDSPEFLGTTGALEAVQTRLYSDEELKTKKRYGRLQKAMGDHCLLAGSPLDAQDHYSTAVELGRTAQDWVYLAAALEGYAAAKVLSAAIAHGAFAINQSSVFNDEEQWRTPRRAAAAAAAAEGDVDAASLSEASRSSNAFGGAQFWAALRGVEKLESEVRGLFSEAKAHLRRRGGLPLLVESDLKLARFLAGLHAGAARREASELVSGLQLAGELLPLPEDRLLTFVEGAQVLGLVGSTRKRVLLLWQAVELSKFLGFPNTRTLDVARKALDPPDDPREADSEVDVWGKGRPLSQTAVPRTWPQIRAGCLEAVLGLAIYAKQHADVWDAAAALLREHPNELSAHRQQSLLENLLAAASQMSAADKSRHGPGPPPLLYFLAPRVPPLPQRPVCFTIGLRQPAGNGALAGRPGSGPFLYDPFSVKREQAAAKIKLVATGPVQWVCGEVASVEVEVANPAAVGMRIDKMVLEATYMGDASMAPREYMTITSSAQAVWKPKPVSLNIPANTKPVRIVLEGTPLLKGMLVLTGCRLTAFGGVSWFQPWTPPPVSLARQLGHARPDDGGSDMAPAASELSAGSGGGGGGGGSCGDAAAPEARVLVVEPLPLVQLSLAPAGDAAQEAAEGLGLLASEGGGTPRALRLLQGQVYLARLTVTNTSKVPLGWASISVRHKEARSRLAVTVDALTLQAHMPLASGQSCSVPVTVAAGVRATHAAEEIFAAEICLECVSADAAEPMLHGGSPSGGGGGAQTVLGRHAVLPVQAHVQPSLQVSQVQFRELYLPAAAAAEGGAATAAVAAGEAAPAESTSGNSSSSFERRAVIEVSVSNRGRWPLQVWLGPAPGDATQLAAAAAADALLPPAVPPGAEGLPSVVMLPPGRRGTVALLLDHSHTADEPPSSNNGSGGGAPGAGGRPAASWEEQQRQAAAERLSRAVALFYRVEDVEEGGAADGGVGTAPLVPGEVFNGLGYRTLAQLQPCGLTVQLSAEPLPGGGGGSGAAAAAGAPPPLQRLAAPEAAEAHREQRDGQPPAGSPYSRFPALTAQLGQPLSVTLTVTNHGRTLPPSGDGSGSGGGQAGGSSGGDAAAAVAAGGGAALDLQLEAAVACQPVLAGESDEGASGAGGAAPAHELTAVWAGQLWTGLRLRVAPGHSMRERLGLCLLAPGLYRLVLQHCHCQPVGAAVEQLQQQHEQLVARKGRGAPPLPLFNTLVAIEPCYVRAAQ